MVWYGSFRTVDFDNGVARICVDSLPRIRDPVGCANEWLREIYGVFNNAHQCQIVAVTDPMLRQRCAIAPRNAITTDPTGLQVCRGDREHIALPLTRREPLPRMRGIVGRMRSAVHPYCSLGSLPCDVCVVRDEFLRLFVDFFPNPQVCGPASSVVGWVRFALMFRQGEQRCVPAVASETRGIIDR